MFEDVTQTRSIQPDYQIISTHEADEPERVPLPLVPGRLRDRPGRGVRRVLEEHPEAGELLPDLIGPLPRLRRPRRPTLGNQTFDLRNGQIPLRRFPLPVPAQVGIGFLQEKS